jgi:hypothetical protein
MARRSRRPEPGGPGGHWPAPGSAPVAGGPGGPGDAGSAVGAGGAVEVPVGGGRKRRLDLRTAAGQVAQHWDSLLERVPAPVFRVLVTLPWVLRKMPVPFWVPLVLMLLRRISKSRRKRRERREARAARNGY